MEKRMKETRVSEMLMGYSYLPIYLFVLFFIVVVSLVMVFFFNILLLYLFQT